MGEERYQEAEVSFRYAVSIDDTKVMSCFYPDTEMHNISANSEMHFSVTFERLLLSACPACVLMKEAVVHPPRESRS